MVFPRNFLAYKNVKNKCNTQTKKTKKNTSNTLPKVIAWSKGFWNKVKPFIKNKGTISDENIKTKAEENQNIKIKNKNKCKLVSMY